MRLLTAQVERAERAEVLVSGSPTPLVMSGAATPTQYSTGSLGSGPRPVLELAALDLRLNAARTPLQKRRVRRLSSSTSIGNVREKEN